MLDLVSNRTGNVPSRQRVYVNSRTESIFFRNSVRLFVTFYTGEYIIMIYSRISTYYMYIYDNKLCNI